MAAYYNEIDPYAAQWLRNLIAAGLIAPGDVDERSIEDVRPDELTPYTQCHFFAGIGVWSLALRRAGWPDDRAVWSGSCPCQPFSTAGKSGGFADERHLWPAWHWLIGECRPPVIFGEQVASKAASPWIDLVHADLEAMDYAFGCVPFPSAGVGAPHIRDRAYWVAHANDSRLEGRDRVPERTDQRVVGSSGMVGGVAHANSRQQQGQSILRGTERLGQDAGRPQGSRQPEPHSDVCRMADAPDFGRDQSGPSDSPKERHGPAGDRSAIAGEPPAGPTNGVWRDADWLFCRDGKWRPVEPGTQPLAHGAASRVGRLRAYGNAINAEQARIFIEAFYGQ